MHRRILALLVPLALILLGVGILPVVAAPLPASLMGESLDVASGTGTGSATCTSLDTGGPGFRGSGSETFNVSGPASGPYPGTFTAQGTISVSADASTFDVNETFTITSSAGTVTGTKQGTAIPIPKAADGTPINVICQNFTNAQGAVVPSLEFTSQVVPWSATISTTTGTYSDSGLGTLLAYTGAFGSADGSSGVIIYHPSFSEQFSTSNGVAVILASPTLSTSAEACCVSGSGSRFQVGAGTTVGGSLADTATLSGGNAPTGSIVFNLFGPNDATCAAAVFTSSKSVSGSATYSSDAYTPLAGGTYRWVATYSGDPNNRGVITACSDSNESSLVTACGLSLVGGAPCGEQFAAETTGYNPPLYPPGFGGSVTTLSKSCGPDGTGTFAFSADGTATGPYPGTFHESGTIAINATHVITADAQFTITTAIGNVSGTKSLDTSAPSNSAGNCNYEPASIDPNMFLNFSSQQQQTFQVTITNAQGKFSESGISSSIAQTSFQSPILNPPYNNTFTEGFSTSNGVIPVTDTDLGLTPLPVNTTTVATTLGGAPVTYIAPTATDEPGDSPVATASCLPGSGSTFPIGTTTVTCTASDADDSPSTVTGAFPVTVNAGPLDHLVLSPASSSITAGGSQSYTATGFDLYGNSLGNVTSGTTFSIAPNGSCTGASCTATVAGTHTVTGTDGSATGTASLTVNAGVLDHLVLSPASSSITAGGSQSYTATGFDLYGNSLGDVTSSTSFSIAPNGSCTGASCTATAAGAHTVTGTDTGKVGTASLTVNAGVLDHLVLSPASSSITAGGSQSYTATGFDLYGNNLGDVTAATTFSIAPNGSCTGASCTATAAGAHTVTGTDTGKVGTASLTVNAGVLDHLVLSPASSSITAGGSQSYTATGFDLYGNNLGDVTAATTFSIAPNGSCTGASCTATVAGTHTVTGTDGSATGTASLTVNATAKDQPLTITNIGSVSFRLDAVAGVTFTDADPKGTLAQYSATIDWGDHSTPSAAAISRNPFGGFAAGGSHHYTKSGVYTVTITVKDVGGAMASRSTTLTVR